MKYLVEIYLTPEAGQSMESRPGGPGPVVGRMIERFKPDMTCMALSERLVYMLVELDDVALAELMIAGAEMGGEYPTFTPVVEAENFPGLVGQAVEGAKKIREG